MKPCAGVAVAVALLVASIVGPAVAECSDAAIDEGWCFSMDDLGEIAGSDSSGLLDDAFEQGAGSPVDTFAVAPDQFNGNPHREAIPEHTLSQDANLRVDFCVGMMCEFVFPNDPSDYYEYSSFSSSAFPYAGNGGGGPFPGGFGGFGGGGGLGGGGEKNDDNGGAGGSGGDRGITIYGQACVQSSLAELRFCYQQAGSPSCSKCAGQFIAAQMSEANFVSLRGRLPASRRLVSLNAAISFTNWNGAFDDSVFVSFFGFSKSELAGFLDPGSRSYTAHPFDLDRAAEDARRGVGVDSIDFTPYGVDYSADAYAHAAEVLAGRAAAKGVSFADVYGSAEFAAINPYASVAGGPMGAAASRSLNVVATITEADLLDTDNAKSLVSAGDLTMYVDSATWLRFEVDYKRKTTMSLTTNPSVCVSGGTAVCLFGMQVSDEPIIDTLTSVTLQSCALGSAAVPVTGSWTSKACGTYDFSLVHFCAGTGTVSFATGGADITFEITRYRSSPC